MLMYKILPARFKSCKTKRKKERIVFKKIIRMILLVLLIALTTVVTYHQLMISQETEQSLALREDDSTRVGNIAIGGNEFVRGTIGEMMLLVSETDGNATRFEIVMNETEDPVDFPKRIEGIICAEDIERIRIPTNASVPVEMELQRNEDGSFVLKSVRPLAGDTYEMRDIETELWLHSKISESMKDFPRNEDSEIWTKGFDGRRRALPRDI